jgi:arylsulfatase A-like enzyme
VKAYLACIAFVDAQVGKLLDALDAGPNAGNTMVVLWGDHGWHLGEKQHWGKWTGWQRATHVPLIVAPPKDASGDYKIGATCSEPVSLLDVYPTLIDCCGLPALYGLSGRSLAPLMRDPVQRTDRAVLTTFDRGNYSVMASRWHYIRYADGSEELYDLNSDPHEWTNLSKNQGHLETKQSLGKHLPVNVVPTVPPPPQKKKSK